MKKLLFLFATCASLHAFDQVVIWGHKLHSHTHSYIHEAFFRAFNHMGYKTLWLDDEDDQSLYNFKNSLFITEGQVDKKIPLRQDCVYVLHNCDDPKYKGINGCKLQVYTDDVLSRKTAKKIAPCIYYDLENKTLYMPWATDQLPNEIDTIKKSIKGIERSNYVAWVGTICDGEHGNIGQLEPFFKKSKREVAKKRGIEIAEHIDFIRNAYMAPTIVGKWQKEKGYIPCRIFKNISYGQMGITNSKRVAELFGDRIVYEESESKLFTAAEKRMKSLKEEELFALMDFVRDNHTYVQRIETILDFMEKCNVR
ncbi:MAG: hypothetical protein MRY21_01120 [Simkaniaceae bacterium]|nr:hypothetical protein [Simkaniaceae bacterium]